MTAKLGSVWLVTLVVCLLPVRLHAQSDADSLAAVQSYLDFLAARDSAQMPPYHPAGTPRAFCTSWATRFGRDAGGAFPNPTVEELLRRHSIARFGLDSVDQCIVDKRVGYVDFQRRLAVEISVGIVAMTNESATLFFGINPWMWPGAGALQCQLVRTDRGWVVKPATCRGWDT